MLSKNEYYVNFTFKKFENHQLIMDYIKDPDYMFDKEKPGICFGFSVIENKTDDIQVKLAFSGTYEDASR